MSVGPDVATGDITPPRLRRPLATVWRIVRRQPRATVGVLIIVFFVAVAVLAPWLAPYGVTEKVGPVFAPPSRAHPLGLDDAGVDMLSLMMWGARVSLVQNLTGPPSAPRPGLRRRWPPPAGWAEVG
jgi:ABC-type dipeptide/oligopeptide/nickel transport system permease subunit